MNWTLTEWVNAVAFLVLAQLVVTNSRRPRPAVILVVREKQDG